MVCIPFCKLLSFQMSFLLQWFGTSCWTYHRLVWGIFPKKVFILSFWQQKCKSGEIFRAVLYTKVQLNRAKAHRVSVHDYNRVLVDSALFRSWLEPIVLDLMNFSKITIEVKSCPESHGIAELFQVWKIQIENALAERRESNGTHRRRIPSSIYLRGRCRRIPAGWIVVVACRHNGRDARIMQPGNSIVHR